MNPTLRSARIAGVLADVLYTVISAATGTGIGAAAGVGLIFFVVTTVIVHLVATLISRNAGARRR